MTTGKTIALTRWTLVGKVMLLNMLSRLVITFLPRSKRLLISWLQSPSAVIFEPPKIVCHCFHCFPIYFPWSDGTGCPNDWRNANQNDEGVIPKQQSLKSLQRTNAREGPKKRELTTLLVEIYTGNSHYGEQYRNPIQKKKNHRAPMRFQDFTPGWVCLQRKPSFQRTQAPQRCWWHYLQQPRHGTLKWPSTDEWMRTRYIYPTD